MKIFSLIGLAMALLAPAAAAEVLQFPNTFKHEMIAVNGTKLHVRVGVKVQPLS